MKTKRQADRKAWQHLNRKQRRRYWKLLNRRAEKLIVEQLCLKARNPFYDWIMANCDINKDTQ